MLLTYRCFLMMNFFQESMHRFHTQFSAVILENVMFRCGRIQYQQMWCRQIVHHNGMSNFRAPHLYVEKRKINNNKLNGWSLQHSLPNRIESDDEIYRNLCEWPIRSNRENQFHDWQFHLVYFLRQQLAQDISVSAWADECWLELSMKCISKIDFII